MTEDLRKTRTHENGRVETFDRELKAKCSCGEPFILTEGSDCTCWRNGNRYSYPDQKDHGCIFRCRGCGKPIDENIIVDFQ